MGGDRRYSTPPDARIVPFACPGRASKKALHCAQRKRLCCTSDGRHGALLQLRGACLLAVCAGIDPESRSVQSSQTRGMEHWPSLCQGPFALESILTRRSDDCSRGGRRQGKVRNDPERVLFAFAQRTDLPSSTRSGPVASATHGQTDAYPRRQDHYAQKQPSLMFRQLRNPLLERRKGAGRLQLMQLAPWGGGGA
jgi:hypothetical protein